MSAQTEAGKRRIIYLGIIAALATCLIGAGWQIVTRYGVTTTLKPIDLALFRYVIPGVLLAPLWIRGGLLPRGVGYHLIFLMLAGAGLPFGLLVMVGAQFAPVAHMAVFLPGAMPLFVALLAMIFLQEKFGPMRIAGFALIVFGITAIGWTSISNMSLGAWRGDIFFITAAACWGIYTVAFRKSGLSPWQATAMINGWSLIMIVPVWLWYQNGEIFEVAAIDLMIQILWQGIFAGLLGLWLYGYAISAIGASRAAGIGALVPALSAIGGWLFLMEAVTLLTIIGVGIVTLGVFISTGSMRFVRPTIR